MTLTDAQRKSLVEILVDVAAIRAKRVPADGRKLLELAGEVASGQPTVFEKIL